MAFLTPELTQFCREAPPEFTDQQRSVFCVFSGNGVANLREHLTQLANATAARYAQRVGETGSESDYGDDGTELGETSANEDGVNDVDGGAPLPGQHTMYQHDEDDDATGEEGDDEEEDPLPQQHRLSRSRRRRVSHTDDGRGSSDTVQTYRQDTVDDHPPGPSSLPPMNGFQHYTPHPTVPSQYQFPPYAPTYAGESSTFVPHQQYSQHQSFQPQRSPTPIDPSGQVQEILREHPELRLPGNDQALQHHLLARHYNSGSSSPFGDIHQQQPPLPFTPPPPQSNFGGHGHYDVTPDDGPEFAPSDFMSPQWDMYPTSHPNRIPQPHAQRPHPEHRSSSDILTRRLQGMPAITTPGSTPQGLAGLHSSSPYQHQPQATPESSSRLMDIDMQDLERQVQSFPPLSRGGSAPTTPDGTPSRSFSGPVPSSLAARPNESMGLATGSPHFLQMPPWLPLRDRRNLPMGQPTMPEEHLPYGADSDGSWVQVQYGESSTTHQTAPELGTESQLRGHEAIDLDQETRGQEDANGASATRILRFDREDGTSTSTEDDV